MFIARRTTGTCRTLAALVPLFLSLLVSLTPSVASEQLKPQNWIKLAVEKLCGVEPVDGLLAQEQLQGAWLLNETEGKRRGQVFRIEQRFSLPVGDELRVVRFQPGGRLRRFSVEVHRQMNGQLQPYLQGMADGACTLRSGRRIVRSSSGPLVKLEQLDGDLTTVRWAETLQAPWPSGRDLGGPRVALIDSGLAYDLAAFRNRLARDKDGKPLGFDYWDMDGWPYDGDVSRGAFLPIRHGTAVASVLVRETPTAALIPLRYPRPDMKRMSDAIKLASGAGARILAMPLGSRKPEQWSAFEQALKAHPSILAIVSAGNDGEDIDQRKIWPATLTLENMIVVTSADAFGRLAEGSNWGKRSVDIMLPAENVAVLDFRGAKGKASGSSYAVPRLAALAARLLAKEPRLTAKELKAKIFARATPSPYEKNVVAVGWIPDPTRD
ncbi:MAG: S8 family serine peptidase [Pseudomonadota bacterium]